MQEHHKFDIYGFLSAKRGHGSHKCSEMEIVMDYKGKKILVIIPAYNEAENIVQVVEQMRSVAPWCDYLVVNDGSTDKTPAICEGQGFRYLDLSINMGIGGAVQAGYIYAYKNDYDIAVQMDGD